LNNHFGRASHSHGLTQLAGYPIATGSVAQQLNAGDDYVFRAQLPNYFRRYKLPGLDIGNR
jgi:hypothetical protein